MNRASIHVFFLLLIFSAAHFRIHIYYFDSIISICSNCCYDWMNVCIHYACNRHCSTLLCFGLVCIMWKYCLKTLNKYTVICVRRISIVRALSLSLILSLPTLSHSLWSIVNSEFFFDFPIMIAIAIHIRLFANRSHTDITIHHAHGLSIIPCCSFGLFSISYSLSLSLPLGKATALNAFSFRLITFSYPTFSLHAKNWEQWELSNYFIDSHDIQIELHCSQTHLNTVYDFITCFCK